MYIGLMTPKFPNRVMATVPPNQYCVMIGKDWNHCAGPGWSATLLICTIQQEIYTATTTTPFQRQIKGTFVLSISSLNQ
jgi:hypothetical protein